eukprot:COSAG03_NODE_24932_length_269_cov_0.517647_1_plen_57_part_10
MCDEQGQISFIEGLFERSRYSSQLEHKLTHAVLTAIHKSRSKDPSTTDTVVATAIYI